jgi:hypothetical protein
MTAERVAQWLLTLLPGDRFQKSCERIADLEEWKESALRALSEWHEARELIGGAEIGDGPIRWAKRIRDRLEKAESREATLDLNERLLVAADRIGVRAQALEEAAKVAEEYDADPVSETEGDRIASAIRALKEKP